MGFLENPCGCFITVSSIPKAHFADEISIDWGGGLGQLDQETLFAATIGEPN